MLCAKCHTDSAAGAAFCRSCGTDLPVSDQERKAAETKRRAAEIADLRAKIAAKAEADKIAQAEADALKMSEAELDSLRREAGVAITADASGPASADASARTGQLPDDFPGRSALHDAGINTYTQLRKVDDVSALPGIGPATAAKIASAV